jgi:tetratricopeptide (TPR) repeat protein
MISRDYRISFKRKIWLLLNPLLLYSLICLPVSGQDQSNALALKHELSLATQPEERIPILLDLAGDYVSISTDSSIFFLNKAIAYFDQADSLPFLGTIYEIYGDVARCNGDFIGATEKYEKAINHFERLGDDKPLAKLYNYIGGTFAQSGNLSEAFKYFHKAEDLARKNHETNLLARINNNLGRIFISSDHFQKGIAYYLEALSIFEAEQDSFRLATVMMNLGAAYNHLERYDSARHFSMRAIAIYESIDKKYYLGSTYLIMSFISIASNNLDEANIWLEKAFQIARETGKGIELLESKLLLADVLTYLGITYHLSGDYKKAKDLLLSGLYLTDSIGINETKSDALQYLSDNYEKLGMADSSVFYFKLFKQSSDSLLKMQSVNILKVAEAQLRYEQETREKKIQFEYQQTLYRRNVIIFSVSGLVLLSLVIILILRLRIETQKKKQIELEKKQAELEKEAVDSMLEFKNKELAVKVLNSARNHELVINVAEKLKAINVEDNLTNYRIRNELISDLIKSTHQEDNWKEFEMRFQEVHSEFYEHLCERFPDLTPGEIRLAALLRLNMTTKEISALTHQSERAIILARHRLRHKLGLQTSDNLVVFLSKV